MAASSFWKPYESDDMDRRTRALPLPPGELGRRRLAWEEVVATL
jgi:hypothetical protein